MLRVELSLDVVANLRSIDARKAAIDAMPLPGAADLRRLEREFYEETAYHAMRLAEVDG